MARRTPDDRVEVSCRITLDEHERLRKLAKSGFRSTSAQMHLAIAEHLERNAGGKTEAEVAA